MVLWRGASTKKGEERRQSSSYLGIHRNRVYPIWCDMEQGSHFTVDILLRPLFLRPLESFIHSLTHCHRVHFGAVALGRRSLFSVHQFLGLGGDCFHTGFAFRAVLTEQVLLSTLPERFIVGRYDHFDGIIVGTITHHIRIGAHLLDRLFGRWILLESPVSVGRLERK